MAEYDNAGSLFEEGRQSRAVPLFGHLHYVGQIDAAAADIDRLNLRESRLRTLPVIVAPHRRYRRNLGKLLDDLTRANVPGVEDMLHPLKQRRHARVIETMGIGDHSNQQG